MQLVNMYRGLICSSVVSTSITSLSLINCVQLRSNQTIHHSPIRLTRIPLRITQQCRNQEFLITSISVMSKQTCFTECVWTSSQCFSSQPSFPRVLVIRFMSEGRQAGVLEVPVPCFFIYQTSSHCTIRHSLYKLSECLAAEWQFPHQLSSTNINAPFVGYQHDSGTIYQINDKMPLKPHISVSLYSLLSLYRAINFKVIYTKHLERQVFQ